MLPVSVLPIAGIPAGCRFITSTGCQRRYRTLAWQKRADLFCQYALIFAIGVALGFTNNDGVFGSGGGSSVWHHGENHGCGCAAGSAFTC